MIITGGLFNPSMPNNVIGQATLKVLVFLEWSQTEQKDLSLIVTLSISFFLSNQVLRAGKNVIASIIVQC